MNGKNEFKIFNALFGCDIVDMLVSGIEDYQDSNTVEEVDCEIIEDSPKEINHD